MGTRWLGDMIRIEDFKSLNNRFPGLICWRLRRDRPRVPASVATGWLRKDRLTDCWDARFRPGFFLSG